MSNETNTFQVICPNCHEVSLIGNKFCSHCGHSLESQTPTNLGLIDARVEYIIKNTLKDKNVVEVEVASAVFDKLTSWAKHFAFWFSVPLALVFITLTWLGLQKYEGLSSAVDQALSKINPILERAMRQANDAEENSAKFKTTTELVQTGIIKDLTDISAQITDEKTQFDANIAERIRSITPRLDEFENKSVEIDANSKLILKQFDDLQMQLKSASKSISDQEKKIADTSELVRAIFSNSTTDFFRPDFTPDKMVVLIHDETHASVYFLLSKVPLEPTVQLQYYINTQQKNVYNVLSQNGLETNLVALRWGANAAELNTQQTSISYIADTRANATLFKKLTLRGDAVYADNEQIPYAFPNFEHTSKPQP